MVDDRGARLARRSLDRAVQIEIASADENRRTADLVTTSVHDELTD